MKLRDKQHGDPYLEEAIVAIAGVALGGLGGFVAGPLGMAVGSIVGPPLGLLAAKKYSAQSAILLDRILGRKRLHELLQSMLCEDINNSVFQEELATQIAMREAASMLTECGLQGNRDCRVAPESYPKLTLDLSGSSVAHDFAILKSHGSIYINCAAIHPLPIAAIKQLQKFATQHNVDITLDYTAIRGSQQLEKGGQSDFLVIGNEPFFLSGFAAGKDFRLVYPLYSKHQYAFVRRAESSSNRHAVHIIPGSSAESQFRRGSGIFRNSERADVQTVETLDYLIDTMPLGDSIIVWDPLTSLLRNRHGFSEVPNSHHRIWVSIYAHKAWKHHSKGEQRDAFFRLFLRSWRACVSTVSDAREILLEDDSYMAYLEAGAGLYKPSHQLTTYPG